MNQGPGSPLHAQQAPPGAPRTAGAARIENNGRMNRSAACLGLSLWALHAVAGTVYEDDFESGWGAWKALAPDHAEIVPEAGTDNHVLRLTPRAQDFSHVILDRDLPGKAVRLEGRFLFPTEGDGYLGFIYNHRVGPERTDFGVLYVKSNGNYVRVSPHYDGNPSWRLYEELKVDLDGERRIVPGRWYDFRLDVHGKVAELYLVDLTEPVVRFAEAPTAGGSLGLEARPGRGEPVWVDDIRVTALPEREPPAALAPPPARLGNWRYLPAVTEVLDARLEAPELAGQGWLDLEPDARGAIITGALTQSESGDRDLLYLRASFTATADGTAWLAISSANRIDTWFRGFYRGTVAPERFIWSDHLTRPEHYGARFPLLVQEGLNEITLRVHGDRFAGGGFFAEVIGTSSVDD